MNTKNIEETSVDNHISDKKDNANEDRNIPTLNKDLINDSVNKAETKSYWHKGVKINNKETTKNVVPNNNAKISEPSTDKDFTNRDSSAKISNNRNTDISAHKLLEKNSDRIKFNRKIDTNKLRSKTIVFNGNNIETYNYVKSFQIFADHESSTDSTALLNDDGDMLLQ